MFEKYVYDGNLDNAAKLCKPSVFTAKALGIACRFCGLDMVKGLVERGANLGCHAETSENNSVTSVERGGFRELDYSLMLIEKFPQILFLLGTYRSDERKVIPTAERVKIAEYLLDNAQRVKLCPERLMYFSICYDEPAIYELLKSRGIRLSDDVRQWRVSNFFADKRNLIGSYRLSVRECGLNFFNKHTINKIKLLRYLIDNDAADCLAELENYGWFKAPKKRDELIRYASEHGSRECAAWLLEYKNRTADIAAEREKAEKKMQRELNAAPDSVSELKKLWRYEKREDGTLIITGYKGSREEIVVPERIGKSPVTAIGEYAFSPNAPRLTEEQTLVRCRITKITVPSAVRTIGKYAFGGEGAVKGNFNAFSLLAEVILPEGLEIFADKKSAENAPKIFANCPKLTVKIPHSPYAEMYCRRFNLSYSFK